MPWAGFLDNKDLGALPPAQTLVRLNASVEGRAQISGLRLKVPGPGFDGGGKEDGKSLVFLGTALVCCAKPARSQRGRQ